MELAHEVVGAGPPVALLHGFTQTGRSWRRMAPDLAARTGRSVVVLDAPGHGGSARVDADLWGAGDAVVETVGPAALLGYSMGGRVALHAALSHADAVERLVLVGATAGIADDAARAARLAADEALARRVLDGGDDGLEAFLRSWVAQPLFDGMDEAAVDLPARLENTAAGLASSLRRCGTGTQRPLDDALRELRIPTLLVVGGRDEKFRSEAARLEAALPDARTLVIDGAGHACHLERPEAFLEAVVPFLTTRAPDRA